MTPLLPGTRKSGDGNSNVHHAGHARANVKYSVRAPGPDMSMPPLRIAIQTYRGFYDVRVVRMEGSEFTTEEMLRTRHRTLWVGQLVAVLVAHAEARSGKRHVISGFRPGVYLNLQAAPHRAVVNTAEA
jgi:hypothetical protein